MGNGSTDQEIAGFQKKLILLPKYFLPATGGLQIATARIGAVLVKMGWQVSVYFPAEPDCQTQSLDDYGFKSFSIPGQRKEFWDNLPDLLGRNVCDSSVLAIGLEREESIDAQIKALQILHSVGAQTFLRITSTNDLVSRMNAVRLKMLSQINGIVVLNRAMEKEAEHCNLESRFVHRIPVTVDLNQYCPNKEESLRFRESRGIKKSTPIVLYVGRLDPGKRIELLIESMVGVDALLRIVGDPTLGPDIKETERYFRLARNCGLRAIRIESQVSEKEVPKILQAADVFVTASHGEGMSNAVLEASSVGLAIAGFAIPGVTEIAEGLNYAGFCLAHPDSGHVGLRQAIRTALKYPVNWRLLRETGLVNFSPKKIGALWSFLLSGNIK